MKGQTQGHAAPVCESKSVPDCPTETSRPRPLPLTAVSRPQWFPVTRFGRGGKENQGLSPGGLSQLSHTQGRPIILSRLPAGALSDSSPATVTEASSQHVCPPEWCILAEATAGQGGWGHGAHTESSSGVTDTCLPQQA